MTHNGTRHTGSLQAAAEPQPVYASLRLCLRGPLLPVLEKRGHGEPLCGARLVVGSHVNAARPAHRDDLFSPFAHERVRVLVVIPQDRRDEEEAEEDLATDDSAELLKEAEAVEIRPGLPPEVIGVGRVDLDQEVRHAAGRGERGDAGAAGVTPEDGEVGPEMYFVEDGTSVDEPVPKVDSENLELIKEFGADERCRSRVTTGCAVLDRKAAQGGEGSSSEERRLRRQRRDGDARRSSARRGCGSRRRPATTTATIRRS